MIPTLMVVKVIIPVCLLSLKENPHATNTESDDSSSPQNVSRIECDSSSPTPTDPNEIAFFEFVGDEYDFPLDINFC